MNVYTATEQAHKNGYEAGVKEFAERVKNIFGNTGLVTRGIDTIAKELIDKQRKEDEEK